MLWWLKVLCTSLIFTPLIAIVTLVPILYIGTDPLCSLMLAWSPFFAFCVDSQLWWDGYQDEKGN